jgi:hypothetical protein
MPLPKTNLFRGDRVRLRPAYVQSQIARSPHYPTSRYSNRVGVIVSDTLDPRFDVIVIHWDGCNKPLLRSDRGYHPDDLELVED